MTYQNTQLLIAGKWQDAAEGRTLPVFNPANEQEIGQVAHASTADLDAALAAAQIGFEVWRDMPAIVRSNTMRAAAALLRERVTSIATVLTQEQGKPLAEARGEIMAAADIIEWFADEGMRVYGRIVPSRNHCAQRQMVLRDPVGPIAAFTPWNFPITQVVRKVSAALAAGCSILVKGPEETPASPACLLQTFVDAGIPAGVVGLVYGDPAHISSYLIAHPIIRKITFTGSTPVGKHLAALAGQHMKRATMELGGHAPFIVAEDADFDLAVRVAAASKFRNAGQVCISPTRFLVHESMADEFAQALAQHARALHVGNGLDAATQMGPLVSARRIAAMQSMTSDALAKGAQLVAGGKRSGTVGHFWEPTVLTQVPVNAAIFNEEPFGPVAAIQSFSTLEAAVKEANRLPFGLSAYAFTQSLQSADVLTRRIESGMLWLNMPAMPSPELPFGGIKESGYGSEGGPEAMEMYLNVRTVVINHG